ncbi:glycoside hydrolase N-terminal domain-containing protein [Nocardiopsis sp. FIRDI 009]|uniref:glycosyl hydrolase family 95 catalytic domain-containing protein n=1 Tax=Nocardiopsis sp. FIRDI 009 TaxID=714197 RepID=UPI000E28381E|nr:glycoside hydrolase N-terminal domain-containing protein [Nocardiopsis sp. FIRDI 009]
MSDPRHVRTRHPVRDWEDALVTGNGRLGALVHGTAAGTRLTLGHERLFLPTAEALPAPNTARILPELRRLLRQGRSRAAAERIVAFAADEHPGYAETRWIDPLFGAAVLGFTPADPGRGPVTRTCDLDSGLVTEDLPDGTVHRVFASRPDDAVVAELSANPDSGGLDGWLRLTLLDERPPVPLRVEATAVPDLLTLRVAFPDRPDGALPGYAVTCSVVVSPGASAGDLSGGTCGAGGRRVPSPDAGEGGTVRRDGVGLELRGVTRVRLVLRVHVGEPGEADPPAPAPGPHPTDTAGHRRWLDRHRAVHGDLMDRFRLTLHGPRASTVPTSSDGSTSPGGPTAPTTPATPAAPTVPGGPADHPAEPPLATPLPAGPPLGEDLLAGGPTPELVTRLVDAGRYAIVSSCGDLPPTLQGVWSGTYAPPWRSGYTFDGNLPSAVAALHPTGTPELMTGLFDLLDRMAADLEENARRLYGCRGILVPPHASTSGRHNHFGPQWCLTCWTAGAAWMARLHWDHYSHTRDRDFLRERALPFLTAAGEFHEDFLTEDGFVPSYSPENTPGDSDGQAAVNATMDVAAVRDLTRNLVRAHHALGVPGARRWARLAARLPGYRIAAGGELAEWAGPAGAVAQTERHGHRHASHLFPLWYEGDPIFAAPRWRAAAVRAVRSRLAWWRGQESDEMAFGLVQLGLAAARLGLAEEAHETLALMATRYWRPTLVPTHNRGELFNVDIGGGFPAVAAAMLAGSGEGWIEPLPALPRAWPSGRVEGLRARGGVVVDRLEWSEGRASTLLRSVEPRSTVVRLPDASRRRVSLAPERQVRVDFRTGVGRGDRQPPGPGTPQPG